MRTVKFGDDSGNSETGASDVLVVRNGAGNELLLPAIKDVILEIRKRKTVVVRPESEWDGVS